MIHRCNRYYKAKPLGALEAPCVRDGNNVILYFIQLVIQVDEDGFLPLLPWHVQQECYIVIAIRQRDLGRAQVKVRDRHGDGDGDAGLEVTRNGAIVLRNRSSTEKPEMSSHVLQRSICTRHTERLLSWILENPAFNQQWRES